jgi:hypothetical protein
MRQADGSVVWLEEYRFEPPPAPWQVIDLNETDYSLAFYRSCEGKFPGEMPCEASIAYAEEPFGYSRDLRKRAGEFFKRYLWASRVEFNEPQLVETTINGRKALIANLTGEEPVHSHRLTARVVFMRRGERVVAFFMNQWRSPDLDFDPEEFVMFDRFVESFDFVKPSFYETL